MIASIENLDQVSRRILELYPTMGIILLKGDLASGKTTLVKNFVKEIGLDEEVGSPTFSIMNSYANRVYHYDIYNGGVEKFLESGLLENLQENGWHFIEWADEKMELLLKSYGYEYIKIEILPKGQMREYRFEA